MDIEYFTGNKDIVTKIHHIPYQTITYDDKGMFPTKLMDETEVEIFIDNRATLSILPLNTTISSLFFKHIPKQKTILPFIQEEV